jgi:serine/threonine protein kinase
MVPDTDFAPAPVASEEQPQTHDPWACLPTLVATANAGGWLIDPREIEMDGVGVGGTRVVDGSSNENEVGIALGEGSSGFIKRARWRGTLVAAKRVRVDSPSRAKSFIREVTCLSKLRHPHVLPFYGACLSPPNDCTIVARVCGGGTVKDWLYPRGDPDDMPPVVRAIRGTGVPPLQHRLCVARQIAAGMCHLEASGWAHRDLKPGNVFLVDKPSSSVSRRSFKEPSKSESADDDPLPNENTGSDPGDLHGRYADVPTVVVADFGLARCVGDEDDEHDETSDENNKLKNLPPHWTGETGTYLYMAPEVVRSNGSTRRYGLSCDVWSFGVLLHELVAGVPPYRKQRKELLLSATQIALGVESGAVVLER